MSDFTKSFNSVEELEKMLDEEFSKSKENPDETSDEEETSDEDETSDEENKSEDEKSDDEEETFDEEETSDKSEEEDKSADDKSKLKKLTGDEKFKSDKKDFAFKKLREDNSQLKQKLTEKEQRISVWEEIAKAYGYGSAEEMAKVVKEKKIEQEAKQKNIDPEVYKRLHDMEERVSKAEKEKQEQQFEFKKREFVGVFENFIKENKLSEDERTKIVSNLEDEGWDFESLVSVKNPKRLLQGYAVDIIADRKVQKNLEEEKVKKLAETKFKNNSKGDKSIDDIVKVDLEKYARERGIKI
jgi:hypothetical protein